MRRFHVWLAVGALVAFVGTPSLATAQGFSVNEHSTCAMGRAGTAVAAPCNDGSAMVYNPAGLTQLKAGQTQVSVGGTLIAPSGGFTEDVTGLTSDLEDRVFPVPALYLSHGFSESFAAGVGVFAPYGLTTDWQVNKDGYKFPGRFSAYKSTIRNIYIQPTVAYKLDRLSLGAGFDINLSHLELKQRLDLSDQAVPGFPFKFGNLGVQAGTDFADATISGNATSYGFHLGALVDVTDRLAVGFRFLSRHTVDVNDGDATSDQINTNIQVQPGDPFNQIGLPVGSSIDTMLLAAQFQPGGALVKQSGKTSLRLPEQYTVGGIFRATDRFRVLFDWTHTKWEVFDVIKLNFGILPTVVLEEHFENSDAFRVGGEYDISQSSVIRLGYINHNAAAPDETVTPTLPEGPRAEFTGGFGTRLGSNGHIDLAYQYIQQADRRGRTGEYGTINNGVYAFKAHLFGATFTWNF